ncbi:MAG: DUF3429 domain-containing protein [Pseudomonadota bacterium]
MFKWRIGSKGSASAAAGEPGSEDAGAEKPASQGLPQSAAVLAYAGALPLILIAMSVALDPPTPRPDGPGAFDWRVFYMQVFGAGLIAFFGGVRWGVAVMMPEGPTFRQLFSGILPFLFSLVIFAFFRMPFVQMLLILGALPVLLIDDLMATRRGAGAPAWYLGVRTPLTILVFGSFLTVFILLLQHDLF